MAPPAHRRSGINKKAQLGVFTGYVVAGFGALFGAALLAISLLRPETFNGLRSMASDAAAPIGTAGASARTNSQGVFDAIAGYYRAGSRNAALEEEVKIARVRLAEAEAVKQENARLKAVLALATDEARPVAIARLIGSTSASARRLGYISAGRNDGVRPGMPVTSPMGLVGRVLESGAESSRVLLLTDSESMVPVRRASDNVVAFAEGRADGSLRLRLISLGINPIKKGDVFVTSGAGGMFRPGTAVAIATQITRDGAIAQLLSNPAATDVVTVETIWQAEAVEALQAPPPRTLADAGRLMEQLNPQSRRDPYGSRINRRESSVLAYGLPWATILAGSLAPWLPVIAPAPVLPPLGFLLLLAWRLLRPGLLPPWAGLPLGLFDDLYSGQPMGSGVLLFSFALIIIELVEIRFPWRNFWLDWLTASGIIIPYLAIAALLSGAEPTLVQLRVIAPQIVLSIVLFPIIARMVAMIDRFRLMRVRRID